MTARAAKPAIAAKIARPLSSPPTVGAAAGLCGAGAGRCCEMGAAAVVRCRAGAATGADLVAADNGATPAAPVGPPGGSVGSLMVGAADGLGGKF